MLTHHTQLFIRGLLLPDALAAIGLKKSDGVSWEPWLSASKPRLGCKFHKDLRNAA